MTSSIEDPSGHTNNLHSWVTWSITWPGKLDSVGRTCWMPAVSWWTSARRGWAIENFYWFLWHQFSHWAQKCWAHSVHQRSYGPVDQIPRRDRAGLAPPIIRQWKRPGSQCGLWLGCAGVRCVEKREGGWVERKLKPSHFSYSACCWHACMPNTPYLYVHICMCQYGNSTRCSHVQVAHGDR